MFGMGLEQGGKHGGGVFPAFHLLQPLPAPHIGVRRQRVVRVILNQLQHLRGGLFIVLLFVPRGGKPLQGAEGNVFRRFLGQDRLVGFYGFQGILVLAQFEVADTQKGLRRIFPVRKLF